MGDMVGEVVGAYKLTSKLGEGGMGMVWAAEHTLLGKRAAVKMLLPAYSRDPSVVERFFNEAKATTRVRHPGLVDIYDFGYHTDGSAFIVMELLEGESLATRLKRVRRLREPSIRDIVRQIAATVAAAHEANIVHRDLKPDNVFLVPDVLVPGGLRVKVLDFGIAKLIGAESLQKTRTGAVIGTPMYMSPEQARGAGNIDARSDIYSLGCMIFEMAAGRPPYVGAGAGDVLAAHIHEPVPPLDPAELSPPFGALVARMMAKKPDERPASMHEVIEVLDGRVLPELRHDSTLAGVGPRPPSGAGMEMLPHVPAAPSQSHLDRAAKTGKKPRLEAGVSTTLGQSVGELSQVEDVPPRRRQPIVFAGVIVVGVAVGVGAVVSLRGRAHHEAPAPVPVAAPPVATAPPAPAKVKLRIDSLPAGAEVYRPDGTRAGATPFNDEVARGSGSVAYTLKLKGYADAQVTLPLDRDGAVATKLLKKTKQKAKSGDAIVDPFAGGN